MIITTLAVALTAALPARADTSPASSPWVAADHGVELTVGADGALWSLLPPADSGDPPTLRRTTPDGAGTTVHLPGNQAVSDLAPGIGGDAVWVGAYNRIYRVTASGAVSTVTMPEGVLDLHLEPSLSGDRMWFVADVAETVQNEWMWGAGVVDQDGAVTLERFMGATYTSPGQLWSGPQGTRWFRGMTDGANTLTRLNEDLSTTGVSLRGLFTGAVLGPDGLLWVAMNSPAGAFVDRLRADGSVASTIALPVAGGPAVLGPDGAVYFTIERGYLRVTPAGDVRPLRRAASEQHPMSGQLTDSVAFAGDIYFASNWPDLRSGRVDLDGRSFPLVTAAVSDFSLANNTATITVSATGDGAAPTGTVTVVKIFCCSHGLSNVERAGSATLGAGGRAEITVPIDRFTDFHVDYSGDSRYYGTASLDQELPRDNRSNSERYISQTYRDLLQRQPEPAGLQYWMGTLDAGTPRTAVAHALAISSEHRERFVEHLFSLYLDRPVEQAGRDSFVADLSRGATMSQIRASILGSQEYGVRFGGGTVDGYITALYQDVLNRQPDAAGRAFWRAELARGVSKPTMASALLSSEEALRRLVGARFEELLRRSVEPNGLDYWVSLLQRGFREERLIAELIGSQEYYGRALTGTYS